MGWASYVEDIIDRATEVEWTRRHSIPGGARFNPEADIQVVSFSALAAASDRNRQPASSHKEKPLQQAGSSAKRNRLKDNPQYLKLIEREKGLLGDVRIESDVVYWPIGVVESFQREADPLGTDILRFVRAGYQQKTALLRRLSHRSGVEDRIAWLVTNGWLAQLSEDGGEFTLCALRTGSVFVNIQPLHSYFDAITGVQVELPNGSILLEREQLDESGPVMAERDWRETSENVRFLECVVMLIFSGKQNARAVRVYSRHNDVLSLQEIFYDLAMGKSLRLAGSCLSDCVSPTSLR